MKTNMSYEFWRDLNFECLVARTCKAWRGLEKLCTRWRNFENGTGGYRAEDAAPYRYIKTCALIQRNKVSSRFSCLQCITFRAPFHQVSLASQLFVRCISTLFLIQRAKKYIFSHIRARDAASVRYIEPRSLIQRIKIILHLPTKKKHCLFRHGNGSRCHFSLLKCGLFKESKA